MSLRNLLRWAGLAIALGVTPASAQLSSPFAYTPGQPMPQTVTIMDGDTKIGTATVSGNRIVIRDTHNELVGTIEVTREGTAFYDPNGKAVPIGERDKYILGLKDKLQQQ